MDKYITITKKDGTIIKPKKPIIKKITNSKTKSTKIINNKFKSLKINNNKIKSLKTTNNKFKSTKITDDKKNNLIDKEINKLKKKRKRIEYDVFTDGSCLNNCRKAKNSIGGIGVFWKDGDARNTGEPFLLKPITNNRAELQAIITAIEIFELTKINKRKNNILKIHSDSGYCINTMTKFIYSWKKRNWLKADGKEPLNLDLITKLDNLIIKNKNNFKVEFKHVKAHKKEPTNKSSIKYYYWYGNNKADKLARIGGSRSLYYKK